MTKTGYLGIDVSKGYADFLLLDGDSNVLEENFMLQDEKVGRQKLKVLIGGWMKQGLETLYCGVESTGGYENNWYGFLKANFTGEQVFVCRLNPRGVKAVGDAALKRTITDAVSAENIANYMVMFPKKIDYGTGDKPANAALKEGRQHLTYIKMLIKQKVQLNNQFEKLTYQYFSEIMVYCRHGVPAWLLHMLSRFPTAQAVQKAGVSRLSSINNITPDKASALISKAKSSTQVVSSHIGHIIMQTAKELLHKMALIQEEKKYLAELYKGTEEVKWISTIPGVGIDSAIVFALEIENVARFGTVKQMSSFFGVHPTYKQSGDGMWGNYMSKKGRGELRGTLYMSALSAIRYNPSLKQHYARFRAKGMTHYQAAGVLMHKLLRIIYGILKNKEDYSAETDEKNTSKAAEKQKQYEQKVKGDKSTSQLKRNRFQEATVDAPISRQAGQKIKKQIASQTSE